MLRGREWHGDRFLLNPESAMGIPNIAADSAQSLGAERVFPPAITTVRRTKLRMHL
jgi:hypothetical protein